MTKERYPSSIYPCIGDNYLLGFGQYYHKNDEFGIVYNDGSKESRFVESMSTQFIENPLNGLTEITIKLQLCKEVEDANV